MDWPFPDDPNDIFELDHMVENEPELVHVRQGQAGGVLLCETVEKSKQEKKHG